MKKRKIWNRIFVLGLAAVLGVCSGGAAYADSHPGYPTGDVSGYRSGAPRDIQRHWAGTAIYTLMENSVISNDPDGRFRPDHAVSRADAAVMLAGLMKQEISTSAIETTPGALETTASAIAPERIPFSDTQGLTSAGDIDLLVEKGIIQGYPDHTFRPWGSLTRAEFAVVLSNYLDQAGWQANGAGSVESVADNSGVSFSDLSKSFAADAVKRLCENGVLSGYPDNTFRPNHSVTRAEFCAALYRISGMQPVAPPVTLPEYRVIDVPYISQVYPVSALVGCEGTSLLMGLKGKGYAQEVDLRQFLENMPTHPSNPAKGFAGSPFKPDPTKKTRTTIYPPKLAEYGSQYGKVEDFSGSSVKELQAEVLSGNPVVVYVTMRWETPFYRYYNIEGETQRLLSNNHAVLVCGYDSAAKSYYISDPYNIKDTSQEYRYWIGAGTFEPLYNERQHALVVE